MTARQGFVVLLVFLGVTGSASALATTGTAGVQGTVSIRHPVQYLGDAVGKPFYATVTSTGLAVHGVVVSAPAGWTAVACPTAPAGWTRQRTATGCRFSSSRPLRSGVFRVDARTASGSHDLTGRWGVRLWSTAAFSGYTSVASGSALVTTAYSLEVTRGVVHAAVAPGTGCLPPARSAHGPGVDVVLCGINHSTAPTTLVAPATSLNGSFATADGEGLVSGRVSPGTASVVLGTYQQATASRQVGSGKYLDVVYATAAGQTSPPRRLPSYTITNALPQASPVEASTSTGTPVELVLTGVDGDGDTTTFLLGTPAHGSLGPLSAPSCPPVSGPQTCTATVTYIPETGFVGSDAFRYAADDSYAVSPSVLAGVNVT